MDVDVIVDVRAQKISRTKTNWNHTIHTTNRMWVCVKRRACEIVRTKYSSYKTLAKLANDDNDADADDNKNKFTERTQNVRKKLVPKSGKRIFQEINRNTLSQLNVVQHQYQEYVCTAFTRRLAVAVAARLFSCKTFLAPFYLYHNVRVCLCAPRVFFFRLVYSLCVSRMDVLVCECASFSISSPRDYVVVAVAASAAVAVNWCSVEPCRTRVLSFGEMHVLPFAAAEPIDFCIFARFSLFRRFRCVVLHFHRKRSGAKGVPENGNFTNANAMNALECAPSQSQPK